VVDGLGEEVWLRAKIEVVSCGWPLLANPLAQQGLTKSYSLLLDELHHGDSVQVPRRAKLPD
jgi:hypothetical protein